MVFENKTKRAVISLKKDGNGLSYLFDGVGTVVVDGETYNDVFKVCVIGIDGVLYFYLNFSSRFVFEKFVMRDVSEVSIG